MKLFDIYDSWGNPLAEIHDHDPDIGLGCFTSVFGAFLGIAAPVIIWVAWYKVSFSPWSSSTDQQFGVLSMALLLTTTIIYSIVLNKSIKYTFSFVWSQLMTSATLIDGPIFWIIVCLLEGRGIRFSYLPMSMLIFFLMSVGMGFGAAVAMALIRYFGKKTEI